MTKTADRISACFEATLYAGFSMSRRPGPLFGTPSIGAQQVEPWLAPMPPEAAQALFLEKFRAYDGGR